MTYYILIKIYLVGYKIKNYKTFLITGIPADFRFNERYHFGYRCGTPSTYLYYFGIYGNQ